MIFFLLMVLNVFLLVVQAKAIKQAEQSANHAMLRVTELALGIHLLICAGALLLKITYHHLASMLVAMSPVALGGILFLLLPLLPSTIKFRYPRVSFSGNRRKIIFD